MTKVMTPARRDIIAELPAQTYRLAHAFGLPCAKMLRVMKRLERDGMVVRHPKYSAVNSISWALPPLPTHPHPDPLMAERMRRAG